MVSLDEITANRNVFDSFLYTHWSDVPSELEKRASDPVLKKYVSALIQEDLPSPMTAGPVMALFRHTATSNFETLRFGMCAEVLDHLRPYIFEFSNDKFNDRNEAKYHLGKMHFHKGTDKFGASIHEAVRIIDFNSNNNVPLKDVRTLWGKSFLDLHRELFNQSIPHLAQSRFDMSNWLQRHGPSAREYYKPFLALFLAHGVLFDNYMLEGKEALFTREVILGALLELHHECGYRPLIVSLEPTNREGDDFWLAYPWSDKAKVDAYMLGSGNTHLRT